ncbi:MAG: long-chain fatty acid--CoA ligase [Fimbriimonadaceae bacterium]|nr:long-chain fatty acid--CoA ligase [Fimbriimonadaceae bacterium]
MSTVQEPVTNVELLSMGAMLRKSIQRWPERVAMRVPEGSDFRSITYTQLGELVRQYAGALKSLGLAKGDRICLQSDNCYEWALTDWGCQSLGVILVPIYPTLPADQAQYIVRDCGAKIVIAGNTDQSAKTKGMAGVQTTLLRGAEGSLDEISKRPGIELSLEDWNAHIDAVDPEEVATFIYTSGTTGQPKGAMLPHRAITWLCSEIKECLPIDENDTFLCFLPMSHVFERFAGQALPISKGACIGYAKNLASLASDMVKVKPTIVLCVPRFLEATREKILDGVKKQSGLKQKLFNLALSQGVTRARGGFAPVAGVLDKVVGSKIREKTGGRIRFFVSGGAALPQHVAEFYMAMGLNVLQGYGLTETTAATCVNHPDDNKYWTVGMPIKDVQVKLAEDGEILVRGRSVMLGYYNLPEETAAAIDSDGWFHTGDIGAWEGKHLKITDRKKDILVLANGKNVAPQPIENKIKESAYIAEAVVFGDGSECCYALIVPNFEKIKAEIESKGMQAPSEHQMAELDAVKKLIKDEMEKVNKDSADFERVKKWVLVDASFSVESGELTPSLKVKRKVVAEKFAKELESLRR